MDTEFIVSELSKVTGLLSRGRKHGVVVMAKPEVIQAIRESGHEAAEQIASSLSPALADPRIVI